MAEISVTSAAAIAEHDASMSWLLDQRLDWLEEVEDACDAICCSMPEPWVAEATRSHYLLGKSWTDTGQSLGRAWETCCRACHKALRGTNAGNEPDSSANCRKSRRK